MLRGKADPFSLFYIQLIFKDLFQAIRTLYKNQKEEKEEKDQGKYLTVFRATYISEEEINFFRKGKGKYI